MEPYELWHAVPGRLRQLIENSRMFHYLRQANDRLWASQWYVDWQYDFEPVEIVCDDTKIELWVPSEFRPWWREYETTSCHEPLATRTLLNTVESGDVVWDLGSRFGYFSAIASIANETPSAVHTFEASPRSCEFIKRMNRRCFGGKINVHHHRIGESGRGDTLATFAERHGTPDFIKMDIEGAEGTAVNQLANHLRTSNIILLIELHPKLLAQTGITDQQLFNRLNSIYDHIQISFDYRKEDGTWHQVSEQWDDRTERAEMGEDEQDMCHLLCRK